MTPSDRNCIFVKWFSVSLRSVLRSSIACLCGAVQRRVENSARERMSHRKRRHGNHVRLLSHLNHIQQPVKVARPSWTISCALSRRTNTRSKSMPKRWVQEVRCGGVALPPRTNAAIRSLITRHSSGGRRIRKISSRAVVISNSSSTSNRRRTTTSNSSNRGAVQGSAEQRRRRHSRRLKDNMGIHSKSPMVRVPSSRIIQTTMTML